MINDNKQKKDDCRVNFIESNKAYEINLFSFKRPHMRAFWCSNICHRISILLWFSVNPLQQEIQNSISLSREDIWASMIATFCGSLFTRLLAGPICDKFGARLPFAFFILVTCIPTLWIGFVQSSAAFIVVRFFLGIGGGAFVMCHFWIETMFTDKLSGYLHGFTGGIGGVIGMAQMLIGTVAFPVANKISRSTEIAWRLSFIPPVILAIICSFFIILFADDTPKGNISKLHKNTNIYRLSVMESVRAATNNRNVWLIALQYSFNFGVEIILYGSLGLYFQERYKINLFFSSLIVMFAGGSNQSFRVLGGKLSDKCNKSSGTRGRILLQGFLVFSSGFFFIPFASAASTWVACIYLFFIICFLSFAQAATFALLGSVDGNGSSLGLIGAFGNAGAILISLFFWYLSDKQAFQMTGSCIMLSSLLSILFRVPGFNGFTLFKQSRDENDTATLETSSTLPKSVHLMSQAVGGSKRICSPEIGYKMTQGWSLLLDSCCLHCDQPMMVGPHREYEKVCLFCDLSANENSSIS